METELLGADIPVIMRGYRNSRFGIATLLLIALYTLGWFALMFFLIAEYYANQDSDKVILA